MRYLLFAILALPNLSSGDSWVQATTSGELSPDAERLVRIIPGNSWGDTYGFSGAKKGAYARAIYYERTGEDQYNRCDVIAMAIPRPTESMGSPHFLGEG